MEANDLRYCFIPSRVSLDHELVQDLLEEDGVNWPLGSREVGVNVKLLSLTCKRVLLCDESIHVS